MIGRDYIRTGGSARPLGEVVEFLDSRRRPVKEAERKPGPFPYYGANGQQGTIDNYLFDEPLVLLAEDGGFFDQPDRGVAYRITGKTWVNNHAHVLRPKEIIDVNFLCRVLENYDLTPFITGTTRGKLTKAGAEEVLVPVPPLDEQRRIAAILDQADDLRRKRRNALEKLQAFRASTFRAIFGDLEQNEFGWPQDILCNVVRNDTIVTYGIVQAGNEYEGGVPYIRTGDIVDGEIQVAQLRRTAPQIAAKFARSRVEADEIVMSIRATVGTTAFVPTELNGANLTQGTARISPGKRTERHYLLDYLRSDFAQNWLQRQVKGATFREITLNRLREMPILIPPLDRQHGYAARVAEIDMLKAFYHAHLAKLDALFASLQHRAFRGEL